MRQEAHETAISACDSAEATRKTVQSDLDRTTAKASKLLKDTSRGQVADPKTLDALNRLLDAKTTTIKGSCAPDAAASDVDRATEALRRTTKELKNRLTDLKTATKAVTDSKLDKTVDDANALYKETDGRVADDKTREILLKAVKARDTDAIAKAVKEVNESKAAKEKADAEAKAKAEQEAAAAAAAQQQAQASQSQSAPQRQTPSYSGGSQSQSQGSSGSGSGTGRRPSSGGSSSSANTVGASPGWSSARAIRRGHRLARQRSGALTGRAPAAPESQVLVNAISGVLLCLAIVDRLIVALATFMRLNAVGSYRGCV